MNVLNHTQFNGAYQGGAGRDEPHEQPGQRAVPGHRERRTTTAPAAWRPTTRARCSSAPRSGSRRYASRATTRWHAMRQHARETAALDAGDQCWQSRWRGRRRPRRWSPASAAAGGPGRPAGRRRSSSSPGPRTTGVPGRHEHEKDLRILAAALEAAPNLKGVKTEVYVGKAPTDLAGLRRRRGHRHREQLGSRRARDASAVPARAGDDAPHLRPGDARLPEGHRRAAPRPAWASWCFTMRTGSSTGWPAATTSIGPAACGCRACRATRSTSGR